MVGQTNDKPLPKSILVFGASNHIGGPMADYLMREAPQVRLRMATHSAAKASVLRDRFPGLEVVVADYLEQSSMTAAVDGMEGIFFIPPNELNEQIAVPNMIAACEASGTLVHMVRLVGLQPEANMHRIPQVLRDTGVGIEIQHAIAKRLLDESGLPVTYINCGATFMDNFTRLGLGQSVMRERKLIWPERLIPWIDPRDIGEVAARLLLSDNHRHIGQFHTMNNGHDLLRFQEVAELLGEVLGEPITYDGSREAFFSTYTFMGEPLLNQIWNFLQYEQDNEVVWARNDFVERTLGRKPTTLREWLIEHRDMLLGKGEWRHH